MSDILIAILGLTGTFLIFFLGQISERRRQSLIIRAQLLTPIEEWLRGVERMVGILDDTMSSIMQNSPLPVVYNLNERRIATQFMSEKTNLVFGNLESNRLNIWRTKKLIKQLRHIIQNLDIQVKQVLLPLDNEVQNRSLTSSLTPDFINHVISVKLDMESDIREAYSLIAKIKTAFA